ncbi:MAG TPA: hypothetical protein VFF74_09735 [Methylophilaceae bacterium]|nr:hypothetical protein [Methylophilaceae bacterium]
MKLINRHWRLSFTALCAALYEAHEQLAAAMQARNVAIETWMHGQP